MRPNAKPLRILVTDAHTHAGLGAIRSLGRAGHTIIAAYPQGSERPASVWSRYCSGELRYPDSWGYQFEFRDWLLDQAKRETFDVWLPITEASIVGVASVRKELPKDLLAILPGDSALKYTLSKYFSTKIALSLGIKCPTTVFISDGTSNVKWNEDFSDLRYPIVIKTDNYLTKEGVYMPGRSFIAADADEANKILTDLEHMGTRIIAQEKILGCGVGAFILRFNRKTYLRFTHRRLHEVPYTGGSSSFRESLQDDVLTSLGDIILDAIEYEGVAMVEFRLGTLDKKPYFLEINGRLWGSLALALHSGVDFPKALIECYQNGFPNSNTSSYQSGVKCRNIFPGETGYLISVLRAKPKKGIEPPPSKLLAIVKFLMLSLNPTIKHDYFWWTDPLPGIFQAVCMIKMLPNFMIKKGMQRFRKYNEDRSLSKLRMEHQIRCGKPKYFNHPLNQVMFLCYGNICRSPFAEHYWNTRIQELSLDGPRAVSSGFHPHAGRKTPNLILNLAAGYGIDLTKHRSRILTKDEVQSVNAIFIMDRRNYKDLIAEFPWAKHKTYFLGLFADNSEIEIKDPYCMGKENARICYQQLTLALDGLMKRILGYEYSTRLDSMRWTFERAR